MNTKQTQLPRMIETAVRDRLEKELSHFKSSMEVRLLIVSTPKFTFFRFL